MNSRDYWDKRRSNLEALTDIRCRVTASQIAQLYDGALERILLRIGKLFDRFRLGYRLTPEEAMELLSAEQTKEARLELLELFEGCEDADLREELRAKLDAPAYSYRISRLEALRDQVYFDAKMVGAEEIKYQEARLEDVYEQSYYQTVFDLSQEAGENVPFQTLDDPRVKEAVLEYWTPSPEELGQNFSDRVWENTTELAERVREIVTEGLITGGNYQEMAAELEAQMGDVQAAKKLQPDGSTRTVLNGSGAKYRAARLIRTEGNHISGQATIKAFQDAGITRYLYRSLLELRTCKVCGGLDGKDFPVPEQQPGVNMHPMHPNCRCFIAPYHDKDWLSRRTRSAQTGGKNWEPVPQSMTYAEWYAKYVKNKKGLKAQEQATRNRSADQKQFSQYRSILGTDAPESLEEFQRLKYTEAGKWKFTQLDYSRRKRLAEHPETALPDADSAHAPDAKFTQYLFNPGNPRGYAKGKAFAGRLGYGAENWAELRSAIEQGVKKYPARQKGSNDYGDLYEQKMVLFGRNGTPANVVVGWIRKPNGDVLMTSAYIKEMKQNED